MADYNKVGLLVVRERRILLCRKKHSTNLLILPGGCLEAGETELACLERELREELGDVSVTGLGYIGRYTDRAAGAPGKTVAIELYSGALDGTPAPHSEIAELVWFGEHDDRALLAPSLVNKILPDLIARGLLPWGAPGVELLAPARDLECGLAAIDCGADAVYIGAAEVRRARSGGQRHRGNRGARAPRAQVLGARVRHPQHPAPRRRTAARARLAWQLYETGVDALIIQDVGLLEGDLPPLPLIASTQMHNHTPERVAFLEQVGFRRAILARELEPGRRSARSARSAAHRAGKLRPRRAVRQLQRPVLPELRPRRAQRQPRPVRPALPQGLPLVDATAA